MSTPDLQPALSASIAIVRERDALKAQNELLKKYLRDVANVVSFVGCEGSGDAICIEAEMAREDWCPMCRIGDVVSDAAKVKP